MQGTTDAVLLRFVKVLLQGKLQVPHSLALDTCANALYVADRGAAAVRRFNIDGDFAGVLHCGGTACC